MVHIPRIGEQEEVVLGKIERLERRVVIFQLKESQDQQTRYIAIPCKWVKLPIFTSIYYYIFYYCLPNTAEHVG
jgi:hypothetical protein